MESVDQSINKIDTNINLVQNYLKNMSKQIICDETHIKFIDPELCKNSVSLKDAQFIQHRLNSLVIRELSSTQQFTINYDSVIPYNNHIRVYEGTIINETEEPVEIYSYSPFTLRKTCKDGKFFEEHLQYQLKLQSLLSNSMYEDYFCKIHAIYQRKVGLDPGDKELYVFEESLDKSWVSFRQLIDSTGGLIRIPFLMSSQAIMHIIRFWLIKIITIVDICHQNGAALHILRPENFYINTNTLEIKLKTLRGASH